MKVAALILTVFLAAVSAAGQVTASQATEISHGQYYASWRAASEKARGLNRRHVSRTEVYKDGKVAETDEWLYEYVLPDKIRYVHTDSIDGKPVRTEQIDIGANKYCKKGEGAWESVKSGCIGGGTGGAVPNTSSLRFTIEKVNVDGKELTLYSQYITYKNISSKTKDTEGLSYYEEKYWLNKDGLLLRQEHRNGLIDPKTLDRSTVDTYEYNPKDLKIEAPIK